MKLHKLSLKDKNIFNKYLNLSNNELSVYSFANIYIWKGLFDIRWGIINGSLCVFFQDNVGCFLYLPPLGKGENAQAAQKVFEIMDQINKNPAVSRIENVAGGSLKFYQDLGYLCKEKSCDYLCSREELASLGGNKYKHKRASSNYFVKNYPYSCLSFSSSYKALALKLYDSWAKERVKDNPDPIYQGMIKDSRGSLEVLLRNFSRLGLVGLIVKIDKAVRGFTLGFELNKQTFCIIYEITDLRIKGLAQFIFKEFCSRLPGYQYINIMDDSGLENLKRVKLSYHPVKLIPSYIVTRKLENNIS